MTITHGTDVKLFGRNLRHRVLLIDVKKRKLYVRPVTNRTFRWRGPALWVKLDQVEAICTGLKYDGSGPIFSPVKSWPVFPRMPGIHYSLDNAKGFTVKNGRYVADQGIAAANVEHDMEA